MRRLIEKLKTIFVNWRTKLECIANQPPTVHRKSCNFPDCRMYGCGPHWSTRSCVPKEDRDTYAALLEEQTELKEQIKRIMDRSDQIMRTIEEKLKHD